MTRVLVFFTSSYPFGPGEAFVSKEAPYLAGVFDEVVVVSNNMTDEVAYDTPENFRCIRFPYDLPMRSKLAGPLALLEAEPRAELDRVRGRYGLPLTRAALSTVLGSWTQGKRVARLIRELGADRPGAHLTAYSYWANDMALGVAMARRVGWVDRAVSRAHGWDVYFERSAVGFLPFRRFIAEHVDQYRFVSDHGLEYSRERIGDGPSSMGVSRLGAASVDGRPLGRLEPFRVFSCSSLIRLKRVKRIAESLTRTTCGRVEWWHAGDGPMRPAVEEAIAALPGHVDARLLGAVPHAEIAGIYRDLRPSIFVNLSEYEGVPVSIMEAMAAGVPVIATDVGGSSEIVRDGENGHLIPANAAPEEVARRIDELASTSPDRFAELSTAAFDTWAERFYADRNYRTFVTEVLGSGEPSEVTDG